MRFGKTLRRALLRQGDATVRRDSDENLSLVGGSRHRWVEIAVAVMHEKRAVAGLTILLAFILMGSFAPFISPYDPFRLLCSLVRSTFLGQTVSAEMYSARLSGEPGFRFSLGE